ncbi:MHYT domain-containing protein [Pseudanabaena sp. PCC 6802]|uniref:MHYT domain-containing protein n=1 Tax=Pseudanabaena sp. PCC 6802 TaxID=118173 RepID=UPI0003655793|nr:MHYT domain-containing protein [Pseudanabaena sp. PCC 6802]
MNVIYNPYLVVLSAFIAMLASYVALILAGQIPYERGFDRKFWLILGSTSMGMGIWSMHFIAMLAFAIPIFISYDFLIVVVSLIAAIVASAQALSIVSRPIIDNRLLLIGSASMGIAIAGMHYIGMLAMRMQADTSYNPFLFILSVIIAIVVSFVALKIAIFFRDRTGRQAMWGKMGSAVVMGFAVLSMHYTGMAAAVFTPNFNRATEVGSSISNFALATIVGGITFLVLFATLFIVYTNSKTEARV